MVIQLKPISRNIQYEIVDTHVEGYSILYSRWEDNTPSNFNYIIAKRKELHNLVKTMLIPPNRSFPLLKMSKDEQWFPYFIATESLQGIQESGGTLKRFYDVFKDFKPKAWGQVPEPTFKLVGFSSWNNTFINPNGTYAVTSLSDSMCWSDWHRKRLTSIIDDDKYPIRFLRENYYIPGNGYMFDYTIALTEPEFRAFKESKTASWERLTYFLRLWDIQIDSVRKDEDD